MTMHLHSSGSYPGTQQYTRPSGRGMSDSLTAAILHSCVQLTMQWQ